MRQGHVCEVIWVKNGLLNSKRIVVEGVYEPLRMSKPIEDIIKILTEKKYPYNVFYLFNCELLENGHTIPENSAHCAWFNKSGIGDNIL